MNKANASRAEVIFQPGAHLLNHIRFMRMSVGDGLDDHELTRLLRETGLPTEAGFAFLSFAERLVTLSVPPQDTADWYPEQGWIAAKKERMARGVAKKYGLSLHEPPDVNTSYLSPRRDLPDPHHHLELSDGEETMVIAHPHYLKVALFIPLAARRGGSGAPGPPPGWPDLLADLSGLYQR